MTIRDRLPEFEAKRDQYERESMRGKKDKKSKKEEEDLSLPGFLDKVKGMEGKLALLKADVSELKKLQNTLYCAPKVSEADIQKMENLADQILSSSITIRKEIELLSSAGSDPKSQKKGLILSNAEQRVQNLQVDRLSHELRTTMNDFRSSQASYLERTRARLNKQRQIIGDPQYDVNTNSVNLDLNFQNANAFVDPYFLESQKAISELQDIQERERELSDLESQIHEVNMLFKEMHGLVQDQGKTIDSIEKHVEDAANDVQSGNKQLDEAKKHQCAARKKKIICFSILIIVIIIVGIIIAVTLSNNE
ncbi:syntaxin-1A-like [Ostrea edulis]|uniref:syntaxin-1A-like n=1 Tax=Ostrea edulis TaxID=37623 RepID=UPI002094E891|nr:syntaxin-1A-like [Ostrea edulis]